MNDDKDLFIAITLALISSSYDGSRESLMSDAKGILTVLKEELDAL